MRLRWHSVYVETSENSGQAHIHMSRGWVVLPALRERALGHPDLPGCLLLCRIPISVLENRAARVDSTFLVLSQ